MFKMFKNTIFLEPRTPLGELTGRAYIAPPDLQLVARGLAAPSSITIFPLSALRSGLAFTGLRV